MMGKIVTILQIQVSIHDTIYSSGRHVAHSPASSSGDQTTRTLGGFVETFAHPAEDRSAWSGAAASRLPAHLLPHQGLLRHRP